MLDVYRIERQYTSYRFYLFLLAATLIGSSLSLLFFRIVGIARVDHLGFLVWRQVHRHWHHDHR